MSRGTLLKRLEKAEESAKALSPLQLSPFDEDALAIYSVMSYLDATMEPSYHEVEPTAAYLRGQELRDALYGLIIPGYLDEHLHVTPGPAVTLNWRLVASRCPVTS